MNTQTSTDTTPDTPKARTRAKPLAEDAHLSVHMAACTAWFSEEKNAPATDAVLARAEPADLKALRKYGNALVAGVDADVSRRAKELEDVKAAG